MATSTSGTFTTSSCTANNVWHDWTSGTAATAATTTVWITWASGDTTGLHNQYRDRPVELTPEQQAEQERRQAEAQARAKVEREQRVAASTRARELLLSFLSPEQQETFERCGWFIVRGGKTGQRYRINGRAGLAGNVDVLAADNDNRRTHRLCAHAASYEIPHEDHLLAQKLALEAAEEDFLRVANRHAA